MFVNDAPNQRMVQDILNEINVRIEKDELKGINNARKK